LPGSYTTPLAPHLFAQLARLRECGALAAALEVSSHGLALDRVDGIAFDAALLTNIERDHLDFHGTREAYAEAKVRLFGKARPDGWCILNRQSAYFEKARAACSGRVMTYGYAGSGADVEAGDWRLFPGHSAFTVRHRGREWPVEAPLAGKFQIENTLAAVALMLAVGHPMEDVAGALRGFPPVPGRMERIAMPNGCTAIVDYAHNPDGLKHLLENCRQLCGGRLHVVFGCGGDRDRGKRPLMGALADSLADVAWVTSDNPRTEEPDAIIRDVLAGFREGHAVLRAEPDRAVAIARAYAETAAGDILVVAGKGHEDYQIVGLVKHAFSDQVILRQLRAC
jgi:UDP-N-acetylmuramoyl-L-alanyl-D-glutamate--2,6-diaminopimelate ligase